MILPLGHALMAEAVGGRAPAQFLLFCRLGLRTTEEVFSMCDYSLHNIKSRPAKVGDKLTTRNIQTPALAGSLRRKMPVQQFVFFRERSSPLPGR